MTTAHRPTFDTAKGGMGRNENDLTKLSKQYSSRDMPAETRIKYRQKGQATAEEGRTALRMVLATYVSSREGRRVHLDDPAIADV